MPITLSVAGRRCAASLLASALIALSACGGGGGYGGSGSNNNGGGGGVVDPGTPPVVTTAVTMTGLTFSPRAIQVSPSATLTFTNNDVGTAHNVTFAAGAGITNIGDFTTGARTTTAPSAPGTYNYQCTNHAGMSGTITVQ